MWPPSYDASISTLGSVSTGSVPVVTPTPTPLYLSMDAIVTLFGFGYLPNAAHASIEYRSDGATYTTQDPSNQFPPTIKLHDNWWSTSPIPGVGSGYEIFATLVHESPVGAGTANLDAYSSALDTWLPLSSLQWWGYIISGSTRHSVTILDISIRPAGGGATLGTSKVRFALDREP